MAAHSEMWSTFIQDTFLVSDRLTVVMGAHGDRWHTQSKNTSYNKTLGSFNPRASLAYRLGGGISLRGSAYKGFRAPTLNELYRGFRAGNTQTNPNEALAPERLTGADGGVLATRGRLSARVTGFWNVLDDVITNVTVSSTAQLITKLRANADKMRTAGVELETDVRLPASWSAAFSSAIVDARFKGDTSLRNNRVPQVPAFNVGVNVRYSRDDVDRLRPASGDGTAVRGRSERIPASPCDGARCVREPKLCRQGERIRGGRECLEQRVRCGPDADSDDRSSTRRPRRRADLTAVRSTAAPVFQNHRAAFFRDHICRRVGVPRSDPRHD